MFRRVPGGEVVFALLMLALLPVGIAVTQEVMGYGMECQCALSGEETAWQLFWHHSHILGTAWWYGLGTVIGHSFIPSAIAYVILRGTVYVVAQVAKSLFTTTETTISPDKPLNGDL